MSLNVGDIVRFRNKSEMTWTYPPEGLGIVLRAFSDLTYKVKWIKEQKHKKSYDAMTFIDLELEKME